MKLGLSDISPVILGRIVLFEGVARGVETVDKGDPLQTLNMPKLNYMPGVKGSLCSRLNTY